MDFQLYSLAAALVFNQIFFPDLNPAVGLIAAMVACYFGFYAKGGPKGVGDAVNQAVVITFLLLFAVNFVMTALYFQLVPPKGS